MDQTLPIFEPLTKATRHALKPLENLGSYDYLEIRMDADDEQFLVRAESWRELDEDEEGVVDTRATFTGKRVLRCSRWLSVRAAKWYSAFPESSRDRRTGELRVPPTDFTCILIHACWPRDRLIFHSETAKLLYMHALMRFFRGNLRANMVAHFKSITDDAGMSSGPIPDMPNDFEDAEDLELAGYQRVAVLFGLGEEFAMWHMDRGTGKTPCAIGLVCTEAKRTRLGALNPLNGNGHMMRVLIVCPPQVRTNWQREFQRFATTPGKVCILRGSAQRRLRLLTHAVKDDLDCAFSAVIMGYDTLSNDLEFLTAIPWDRVVTDEAHYFKGPSTQRWASLEVVREASARRLELTGSPIANSYRDLFTQFEFLAKGMSGFHRNEGFRSFHGKYERTMTGNGVEKLVGLKNVPLIQERLARCSFVVTKKEAGLNLPEKVYDYYEVDMTPRQAKFYQELCNRLAIELEVDAERMANQSKRMVADHILTKLMRLAQITSGFVTWDGKVCPLTGVELSAKQIEQIDPGKNPKVLAVEELLLQSAIKEKTLIWCCSREDIQVIHAHLQKRGYIGGDYYGSTSHKQRQENVDRFNRDNEFTYLVLNPQSAAEGLNLLGYEPDKELSARLGLANEYHCGHEIFVSCNWSSTQRNQAEDRAHRRGTKKRVRITDLVVPGTVDMDIRQRVQEKIEMADAIQDVRSILTSVLNIDTSTWWKG